MGLTSGSVHFSNKSFSKDSCLLWWGEHTEPCQHCNTIKQKLELPPTAQSHSWLRSAHYYGLRFPFPWKPCEAWDLPSLSVILQMWRPTCSLFPGSPTGWIRAQSLLLGSFNTEPPPWMHSSSCIQLNIFRSADKPFGKALLVALFWFDSSLWVLVSSLSVHWLIELTRLLAIVCKSRWVNSCWLVSGAVNRVCFVMLNGFWLGNLDHAVLEMVCNWALAFHPGNANYEWLCGQSVYFTGFLPPPSPPSWPWTPCWDTKWKFDSVSFCSKPLVQGQEAPKSRQSFLMFRE